MKCFQTWMQSRQDIATLTSTPPIISAWTGAPMNPRSAAAVSRWKKSTNCAICTSANTSTFSAPNRSILRAHKRRWEQWIQYWCRLTSQRWLFWLCWLCWCASGTSGRVQVFVYLPWQRCDRQDKGKHSEDGSYPIMEIFSPFELSAMGAFHFPIA